MARTPSGFLTEDALRSGLRDQWGTTVGPAQHFVELYFNGTYYVVRHEVRLDEDRRGASEEATLSIELARAWFRREVRRLGGRA